MLKKITDYFKYKKEDKEEFIAVLDKLVQNISIAQQEYRNVFNDKNSYVDVRRINDWKNKFSRLHDEATSYLKNGMIEKKKLPKKYESTLYSIAKMYLSIDEERNMHNSGILSTYKDEAVKAFAKISDGTPAEYQIDAVLSEDRRIIITGAPSTGKSTAVKAKIEYLKSRGIDAENDIIALRGTDTKDFAGLAVKILKECGVSTEYERPDYNTLSQKTYEYIKEHINERSYRSRLIDYYINFHNYGHTEFDFDSREKYEKYITLCPPVSLAGEKLKSYEEADIANFLFSLGIKYEYNAPFKENIVLNGSRTRYKPDFTLPEYNICINIIKLNKQGEAPFGDDPSFLISTAEQARLAHDEAEIPLIECYLYEKQENTLLQHLQAALAKYGVKFNIRTDAELMEHILLRDPNFINVIAESILSNIEIILASGESAEALLNASRTKSKTAAPKYKRRERIMSLTLPVYEHYISSVKCDDFRIIHMCADFLSDYSGKLDVKYIFIDDAESLNAASARLILKIAENSGCNVVFAGCSWLCPIGKNGADPVYFQDFGRFYSGFAEIKCNTVFNMPKGIYSKISSFVLNDTGNMEFTVNFPKKTPNDFDTQSLPGDIEKITVHYDKPEFLEERFIELLDSFDSGVSVFIACRYDCEIQDFSLMAAKSKNSAAVKVDSVFNASGKYNIVIWVNTKYSSSDTCSYGFPDEIICLNDMSDLLLHRPDSAAHASERSMLCMAASHTKGRFILLTDPNNASDFIDEL